MSNDPRPIGEKLADIDRQAHDKTPERGMGESSERAKQQDEHTPPVSDRNRSDRQPTRPSRKG
jgi:hypothetical protein